MRYLWVPVAALLTLSACEEEASEAVSAETGGEAAGEILGGTINDDMIPLEELTSTSPPAERSASERVTAGPSRPQPESQSQPQADPAPESQEAEPPAGDPASE